MTKKQSKNKKSNKKAEKKSKKAPTQTGRTFNAKELIRQASAGKLSEKKFKDMLTKHYLSEGKKKDWIETRVKHLWYEVQQ